MAEGIPPIDTPIRLTAMEEIVRTPGREPPVFAWAVRWRGADVIELCFGMDPGSPQALRFALTADEARTIAGWLTDRPDASAPELPRRPDSQ